MCLWWYRLTCRTVQYDVLRSLSSAHALRSCLPANHTLQAHRQCGEAPSLRRQQLGRHAVNHRLQPTPASCWQAPASARSPGGSTASPCRRVRGRAQLVGRMPAPSSSCTSPPRSCSSATSRSQPSRRSPTTRPRCAYDLCYRFTSASPTNFDLGSVDQSYQFRRVLPHGRMVAGRFRQPPKRLPK